MASCLNPIGFDPEALQLKISAEVTGEIDVRSSDYAILWVINRTNSVDVESLTISRGDNPEGYPKVAAKPGHGSTYASYHQPTDRAYTIKIDYKPTSPANPGYSAAQCTGSFTIPEKYMPKAGASYTVYLYRARDGQIVVVEEEMTKDPDPGDTVNPPEPPAPGAETYPLIVRNVTSDANVGYVDFVINSNTLSFEGPNAKDETLNYLEAGQYRASAGLYKASAGLPVTVTTAAKNVPIIKPNDSQSWHTLYMWIYKTKSGGYGTTTTWPPNPNDAADVSINDIAGDGNGILKIVNKSEIGDVIKKIVIDGTEIEFGNSLNPSFTKDMEWMTVLSPGSHTVGFMPSKQNFYGITLSVNIREGEISTLSYYDRLADPDLPPVDTGFGSGLIKIINKSTGVVYNVDILNTNDNNSTSYYFDGFTPPSPINYNQTGRVGVVGDADFPITAGTHYLVMVELELPNGYAVIQRRAALKDQVVEIVINEQDIQQVPGSNVTVVNSTSAKPVQIVSVTLYNQSMPNQAAVFSGATWSPLGYVISGRQAGFRVNSSTGMPIPDNNSSFIAAVTLYGNGQMATVDKWVGSLYNVSQTITITDNDVPPALVETFTAVNNITGIPTTITSYVDTSTYGHIYLNGAASVEPDTATVKGPITWSTVSGDTGYVNLQPNGELQVLAGPGAGETKTVTVKATIAGAAGSLGNKVNYTKDFTISLAYISTVPPNVPVTGINWTGGSLTLAVGETVSLSDKVTINPYDAMVAGIPVTAADITWNTTNPATAVIVNGNSVTGVAPGTVTMAGVIPTARTGSGDKSVSITVTVTAPRPTQRVIRLIRASGHDTVTSVVFVPKSYHGGVSLPTYADYPGGSKAYSIYWQSQSTHPLFWTGQTGIQWPTENAQTKKAGFIKRYPETDSRFLYRTILLPKGSSSTKLDSAAGTATEKYVDVTIPFGPAGSENKYFVFFIEGDGRVRGTSNGQLDPSYKENYYFYVDLDALPDVTRNGAKVVPIFYDSYHNLGSFGIEGPALVNRNWPSVRSNDYD
jgi:hypothetical protein